MRTWPNSVSVGQSPPAGPMLTNCLTPVRIAPAAALTRKGITVYEKAGRPPVPWID